MLNNSLLNKYENPIQLVILKTKLTIRNYAITVLLFQSKIWSRFRILPQNFCFKNFCFKNFCFKNFCFKTFFFQNFVLRTSLKGFFMKTISQTQISLEKYKQIICKLLKHFSLGFMSLFLAFESLFYQFL